MGIKKGEKRTWSIHKNKNEEDLVNKNVTLKLSEKEINLLNEIKKEYKLTTRDILLKGLNTYIKE